MMKIAAISGFIAVALGAFGAHGLKDFLVQNGASEVWETASLYHLLHTVVLLVISLMLPSALSAFRCFFYGMIVFSGTLYLFALTQIKWLVLLTPFGGVTLLAGWLLLAFVPLKKKK
jgi:uncharacterized membrane protein YgdD (TMEM256/DUF423 family)